MRTMATAATELAAIVKQGRRGSLRRIVVRVLVVVAIAGAPSRDRVVASPGQGGAVAYQTAPLVRAS